MSDQRANNKINVRTVDFSCQTEKKKERERQQKEEFVRQKFENLKLDSSKKTNK